MFTLPCLSKGKSRTACLHGTVVVETAFILYVDGPSCRMGWARPLATWDGTLGHADSRLERPPRKSLLPPPQFTSKIPSNVTICS